MPGKLCVAMIWNDWESEHTHTYTLLNKICVETQRLETADTGLPSPQIASIFPKEGPNRPMFNPFTFCPRRSLSIHNWSLIIIKASHSLKQLLSVDFPGGSDGKASAYNAGDTGSVGPTIVRTC